MVIKLGGPTEIRTRIVGFKVQSDSHYTIRPGFIPHPLTIRFIFSQSLPTCIKFTNIFHCPGSVGLSTDCGHDLETFPSPSRNGQVSLLTGGGGGLMISNNFSRK